MLWKAVAALVFTLAVSSPASAAQPPWCEAEVLNPSERMICADAVLGRLDLQLNEAYRAARRVAPDLDQRMWLAERNSCGIAPACLENAYRSRIAELWAIAAGRSTRATGEDRQADPRLGGPEQLEDAARAAASERSPAHGDDGAQSSDRVLAALGEALGSHVARSMVPALDAMTPRPWCEAARLNRTERAVCAHRDLSRLDALLELVYGDTATREGDREQIDWLRLERDACGADQRCIAQAYAGRIEQLHHARVRVEEPEYQQDIPPEHYPPPGSCRIWYLDRPPGRQPPPTSCDVRVPPGAVLIRG